MKQELTPPRSAEPVGRDGSLLEKLRVDLAEAGLGRLVEAVGERSGYVDELHAENTIEARGRLENISELVSSAMPSSRRWISSAWSAMGFLRAVVNDDVGPTAGAADGDVRHTAEHPDPRLAVAHGDVPGPSPAADDIVDNCRVIAVDLQAVPADTELPGGAAQAAKPGEPPKPQAGGAPPKP